MMKIMQLSQNVLSISEAYKVRIDCIQIIMYVFSNLYATVLR